MIQGVRENMRKYQFRYSIHAPFVNKLGLGIGLKASKIRITHIVCISGLIKGPFILNKMSVTTPQVGFQVSLYIWTTLKYND